MAPSKTKAAAGSKKISAASAEVCIFESPSEQKSVDWPCPLPPSTPNPNLNLFRNFSAFPQTIEGDQPSSPASLEISQYESKKSSVQGINIGP